MTAPLNIVVVSFVLAILIGFCVVIGAPYLAIPVCAVVLVAIAAVRMLGHRRRRSLAESQLQPQTKTDPLTHEGLEPARKPAGTPGRHEAWGGDADQDGSSAS